MVSKNSFFTINSLALWLTLVYVGFGTFAICSAYPHDSFFGDWALWGVLITLPVNFISFGYRYGNSHYYLPIFIIQTIMIFPAFLLIKTIIKPKFKSAGKQKFNS